MTRTQPSMIRRAPASGRRPRIAPRGAAIQVFLSKFEDFLGTELFGGDRPLVIGRHRKSNLRLKSDAVSRRHCRISLEKGRVIIEDLDSANGTIVNQRPIEGRVEVEPSDTIQIGPFSIKLRALIPVDERERSQSGVSDRDTRVLAMLSADGPDGTEDSPLDLGSSPGIDWQLYEDALLRATGTKTPEKVVPLRLVQGGAVPSQRIEGRESRPPSGAFSGTYGERVAETIPDAPPPMGEIDSRITELEEAQAAIISQDFARPGPFTRSPPAPSRSDMADAFQPIEEEMIWEELSDGDLEWDESELAMPSLINMSSPAFEKYLAIELNRPVGSPPPRAGTVGDRPSRVKALDEVSTIPRGATPAARISDAPPPRVEKAGFLDPSEKRDGRLKTGTRLPARLVTPTDRQATSEKRASADGRATPASPRPPRKARQPEARRPARTPTPPVVPNAPMSTDGVSVATEEVPVGAFGFESVEISARRGDRLLDVCALRRSGEQYVLGHATPQGNVAPEVCHPGLRLVRMNQDRSVDLVFPSDVGGHLIREEAAVTLHELTEGRKYSCLRLKPNDIVTVILGQGTESLSYHVRFTRTPKL